jgi:hypothetical protein
VIPAEPPAWAVAAGLPPAVPGEQFDAYCIRMGIDPEPLLVELTERTMPLANRRLAHHLRGEMPRVWQAHIDAIVAAVLTPERRRELQAWALSNMPSGDI